MALTAGLVAAIAIGCLLVATTVAPGPRPVTADDEAARVESLVGDLTGRGADEATVRSLAAAAVRLGRAQSASGETEVSVRAWSAADAQQAPTPLVRVCLICPSVNPKVSRVFADG